MKKSLLLAVLATGVLFNASCDKVKDKIKANINPFNYDQPEFSGSIPIVATAQVYRSGDQTYVININQIITDNAGGVNINIDNISKITLQKVVLKLENGDDNNNWTNFEYAASVFNTDKGRNAGKPELYSLVGIDDLLTERFTDKEITFSDVNLKEYFNGTNTTVYYKIETKARRATTKELMVKAILTYKIEP